MTRIERQAESDDEVRSNIPPELVASSARVKRGIKASPRMSRTEAFLHYAEKNPDEALLVALRAPNGDYEDRLRLPTLPRESDE